MVISQLKTMLKIHKTRLSRNKELEVRKIIVIMAILMWVGQVHALILRVSGDGTQDFEQIQSAIAQSCDGDTVLVYPGRYYENLSMMGKNITLASLELTTGNLEYKYNTIIDGGRNGSVIIIQNGESDLTIRGFTITNGSGFFVPNFQLYIGGGIQVGGLSGNRNLHLINNVIRNNTASMGGGLFISTSNVFLSGNSIYDNTANSGGGIRYEDNPLNSFSLTFDPVNRCNIYNNLAAQGSDLFTYWESYTAVIVDTFTVANPWNYYASGIAYNLNIVNPFTFDILHTTGHQEINQDLYVAPWGSDSNSGTSPQEPFQTIFKAMYMLASDSQNPKKVYLAEGVYSPSQNNQRFPCPVKTNTSIVGVSTEQTIIDGDGYSGIFVGVPHSENLSISNVSGKNISGFFATSCSNTISLKNINISDMLYILSALGISMSLSQNIEMQNISINNIIGLDYVTRGIMITSCSGTLDMTDIHISNITAESTMRGLDVTFFGDVNINRLRIDHCYSPGFQSYDRSIVMQIAFPEDQQRLKINLSNSIFADNYQGCSNFQMIVIISLNDTLSIQNCTFTDNSGGSNTITIWGNTYLKNNIFWNPEMPYEIQLYYSSIAGPCSLYLENNDLRGGFAGIVNMSPFNTIIWGSGNVNTDPLFRMQTDQPYSLSDNSPLIDAGILNPTEINVGLYDVALNERFWDGDGDGIARIDIGAYEYQQMLSPYNLNSEVNYNIVNLFWEMPVMNRALNGYRIHRNGSVIAEINDPNQLYYTDTITANGVYHYYITSAYGLLDSDPSNVINMLIEGLDIEENLQTSAQTALHLSPNPFYSTADIQYKVIRAGKVKVDVYNIKGQHIKSILEETKSSGSYQLIWAGTDKAGNKVAPGIYFMRLEADGKALTKKMLTLK